MLRVFHVHTRTYTLYMYNIHCKFYTVHCRYIMHCMYIVQCLYCILYLRINPDWISSFHVLRPRNRQDDVVLALTTSGTVKVREHITAEKIGKQGR